MIHQPLPNRTSANTVKGGGQVDLDIYNTITTDLKFTWLPSPVEEG
jgi:hypothetical protein